MTVGELDERLSGEELTEWKVFFQMEEARAKKQTRSATREFQ